MILVLIKNLVKNLFVLILQGSIALSCSSPSHNLLITNVNVIDVVTGEVLPKRTVAIDGDSITTIYTKSIKPGKQTEVVDGTGKYLIPGLWDMHVHNNWNYEDTNDLMLANGITGAREMWGEMAILRKMVEERAEERPIIDIYSAGVLTDGAPRIWPSSAEVTDPTAAEALVGCQVRAGADFIKVYSNLDSACFFAIGKTATEMGVPFSGHVPYSVPIADALEAGMLTSEHLYGLMELGFTDQINKQIDSLYNVGKWLESLQFTLDQFEFDVLKEKLKALDLSKHCFSPTMVTLRGYKLMYDSTFRADTRLEYLPSYMTDDWTPRRTMGSQRIMPSLTSMKQLQKRDVEVLSVLIENNALIIAGTDYPNPWAFPGFSLHDELEIYVQAGMTPLRALQTTTLNPAKVMNNDRIGTIEKGKLASLVLLNSNPLDDINAVRDIESVILRGKTFNRGELDDMLATAKRKAALPDVMTLLVPMAEEGKLDELLNLLETKLDSLSDHYHMASLEYGLNGMGYQSMNGEKGVESAQEIFALNTRLFSHSQNVWDSYAESFLMKADTAQAITYFQKALDIYPCNLEVEKRLMALQF